MYKLAIFVSGRGSNLKAIYSEIEKGNITAEISAVISNKLECDALNFAKANNIQTFIVSDSPKNQVTISYDKLQNILVNFGVDLIILAGFLKKIPNAFVKKFSGKIINIHPALLPSFGGKGMYGMNVHEAVFNSSIKHSGATIHFVDEIYDNGKIIIQESVDISDVKSPTEIAERVLKIEHKLLPYVVKKFSENKVRIVNNNIFIDN